MNGPYLQSFQFQKAILALYAPKISEDLLVRSVQGCLDKDVLDCTGKSGEILVCNNLQISLTDTLLSRCDEAQLFMYIVFDLIYF